MDSSIAVDKKIEKKRTRGRPPTGHHPVLSVRVPQQIIEAAAKWAESHDVSRPEAIRRLLELALVQGNKTETNQ